MASEKPAMQAAIIRTPAVIYDHHILHGTGNPTTHTELKQFNANYYRVLTDVMAGWRKAD